MLELREHLHLRLVLLKPFKLSTVTDLISFGTLNMNKLTYTRMRFKTGLMTRMLILYNTVTEK